MKAVAQAIWYTLVILGAARIVANELHEINIGLQEALFPASER